MKNIFYSRLLILVFSLSFALTFAQKHPEQIKEISASISKNDTISTDRMFSGFSTIADPQNLFTADETKTLDHLLKNIANQNGFQIFIVVTGNYFPQDNIEDYSFATLNQNADKTFEKGSAIIVINIPERQIRISTNSIARQNFSDVFCQNLIDETIIPNFREKNYFKGIQKALQIFKSAATL